MSAFIVDKEDIDVLVSACIETGIGGALLALGRELGRALWLENLTSVKYRYPDDRDGEWPGPVGLTEADINAYEWEDRKPQPGQGFGAGGLRGVLDCYVYQSCEHPDWLMSEACEITELLYGVA